MGRWAARRGVSLESVLAVSHGRPTLETLSLVAPRWATVAEAASVEATERGDDDRLVAVTGARELVCALPAAAWGVVTSAARSLAIARLTAAGLPVPRVLITSDDVPGGKPDPSGYLEAARRLSARPQQCLVFEDAPVGVRAGIEAGATVIGLRTTFDALDGCAHRIADLASICLVDSGPPLRLAVGPGEARSIRRPELVAN